MSIHVVQVSLSKTANHSMWLWKECNVWWQQSDSVLCPSWFPCLRLPPSPLPAQLVELQTLPERPRWEHYFMAHQHRHWHRSRECHVLLSTSCWAPAVCLFASSISPHTPLACLWSTGVSGSVPLWQHRETAWVLCSPWLTWCVFFGNSDIRKKILFL